VRRNQAYSSGSGAPLVEEHVPADLDPVGDQRVAVSDGQLGAAAVELAGDVRVGQPDRPGRGEVSVEEHVPADLHPVADQRVPVLVVAGQLGAVAGKLASDVSSRQPDRPGRSEPQVEESPTADFHGVSEQRIAIAVCANQLSAAAGELADDVSSKQPDRPGRGEPIVEEHIAADLHHVGGQHIAILAAASQPGAAAVELADDVRS
jgi:hypothetical protein